MGKKSRPPAPPDPQQTAAAQTQQNVATAIANTAMGQVNQITPDGTLTYEQTGTTSFRDPTTGRMMMLPQYTATTTLSEDAQQLRDASNRGNLALANLGADQAERVGGLLGDPFDPTTVSPQRSDRSGAAPVSYSGNLQAPTMQTDGRALPTLSQGSNLGQLQGAQSLGANQAAQSLQPLQAAGQMSPQSQAGQLQGPSQAGQMQAPSQAANLGAAAQQSAQNAPQGPQLQTGYQNDFGAQRDEVINSLMGRIDEERGRDLEGLRTQLLNSGIREGTEAYNREMENFADRTNRNRLNAIMAGGQEQSRLVNMARDEAAFGNSANQQMFSNEMGRYGVGEDARRFDLSRDDANRYGAFDRGEDIRRYDDAQSFARFDRGEDIRRYDDSQGIQRFGINEDVRRYDDAQSMARFDRGEDIRRFDRADQMAAFDRGEDVRRYDRADDIAAYDRGENVRRFDRSDELAAYDRREDARRYGDAMQMGLFGLGSDQLAFNNATRQQDFGNRRNIQQRDDAIRDANFSQQNQIWDAQDRSRAQALDEAYAARANPINEISALLSGGQVSTPNFAIAQPAQMPTTDVAGITQQNYQNQMAAYQQQQASRNAMMGGLFGLGGAALSGGIGPSWLYGGR